MRTPLIIAGPTAIGKSSVAQYIAEKSGAVIVSADSMLVYKGMDIGTAKPSQEERARVRYVGLDCVNPDEKFSVGDWLLSVKAGIAELSPETPIIVVGGTGLYIKALLNGLDPQPADDEARERYQALFEEGGVEALQREIAARNITLGDDDIQNPRRLIRALEKEEAAQKLGKDNLQNQAIPPLFPSDTPVFCMTMARDLLAIRIEKRIRQMFAEGLVNEARAISFSETASGGIGYKEALAYDRGEITEDEAVELIAARTRQLAKRQYTWFRHQLSCNWIEVTPESTTEQNAEKIFTASKL